MTRPDPALVRECMDENRARLMAVIDALQAVTTSIDLSRKGQNDGRK